MDDLPILIQGGMGAGVSDWRLARAVAETGNLGVVSGTGLDTIIARRLQDGDPGQHVRRALDAFPIDGVADRIIEKYFIDGGKGPEERYRSKPMPRVDPSRNLLELIVAG
ncbi:MAG: nitronate monooxygenase, partial [Actinomycetota bacterium]|nr:nitronate monooxygenase [Actinomycetota bacterium]